MARARTRRQNESPGASHGIRRRRARQQWTKKWQMPDGFVAAAVAVVVEQSNRSAGCLAGRWPIWSSDDALPLENRRFRARDRLRLCPETSPTVFERKIIFVISRIPGIRSSCTPWPLRFFFCLSSFPFVRPLRVPNVVR